MNAALSTEIIHQLIKQYIDDALRDDERVRAERKPIALEDSDEKAELLDWLVTERIDDLREGNYSWVVEDAKELLEQAEISVDPTTLEYKQLLRDLMKAAISVLKISRQRECGNYKYEEELLANARVTAESSAVKETPLISVAFDR